MCRETSQAFILKNQHLACSWYFMYFNLCHVVISSSFFLAKLTCRLFKIKAFCDLVLFFHRMILCPLPWFCLFSSICWFTKLITSCLTSRAPTDTGSPHHYLHHPVQEMRPEVNKEWETKPSHTHSRVFLSLWELWSTSIHFYSLTRNHWTPQPRPLTPDRNSISHHGGDQENVPTRT